MWSPRGYHRQCIHPIPPCRRTHLDRSYDSPALPNITVIDYGGDEIILTRYKRKGSMELGFYVVE